MLLFDIDGTLITAARRGEYRGLVNQKLIEIFGTCGRIAEVDFAGRTDLSIYYEALESEGFTVDAIRDKLPMVESAMAAILDTMAETGPVYKLCPGVRELLEMLTFDRRFLPSLLTGNVERLAEAKLRHAGIWHYFRGRGAFGEDALERDHLPEIAARRIAEHLREDISPERFVIIGDTPRDISCARYFGARVLAVASGTYSVDDLEQYQPDALLQDLSDTDSVIETLVSI